MILLATLSLNFLKFKSAAHTPVVSSLSLAQAQGEVALQWTPDAGTEAENLQRNDHQAPVNPLALRRSGRIRNRLPQDLDPPD